MHDLEVACKNYMVIFFKKVGLNIRHRIAKRKF